MKKLRKSYFDLLVNSIFHIQPISFDIQYTCLLINHDLYFNSERIKCILSFHQIYHKLYISILYNLLFFHSNISFFIHSASLFHQRSIIFEIIYSSTDIS